MIRLKRSEALWIVRGIRLGKFLRCCARAVRRLLHSAPREAEAETIETIEPRLPAARARTADTRPANRDLPRRQTESTPACAERHPRSDLAAARMSKGAGAAAPSRPRH